MHRRPFVEPIVLRYGGFCNADFDKRLRLLSFIVIYSEDDQIFSGGKDER